MTSGCQIYDRSVRQLRHYNGQTDVTCLSPLCDSSRLAGWPATGGGLHAEAPMSAEIGAIVHALAPRAAVTLALSFEKSNGAVD